ncbi:FAD/FMN-containing dehydrogenase [Advenella incenata]|uniref:FAD/FMN-containing dehydrogenase n=1 Tax=Advenella incenata TaxID=267800 RepID=A0A4Q7VF02_9BURK|nr:FAD-binding oxidoreductase [Advenella incenata]RZT94794.1 FAD/FMN-containing dehydrogenase [Advenella incenata]
MNLLATLQDIVGADHVLTGAAAQPYLTDWRGRYTGQALAVVRPASVEQVAQVVRTCVEHQAPMVPQGGNTGLCGGATPDGQGNSVVIALARLNRVLQVDTADDTITVQAGCTLREVQQAAIEADRLFPLSLAAEGSCTIGGNLATNAGGTQVLRYGNTRDLTLGLEVVTADGEIWHGLRGLRKDNTGYDLRDLYIGSEGTLGIITAATLKLYPQPVAKCTAMLAFNDMPAAVRMLARARKGFGAALTGFELISHYCLDSVTLQFDQQKWPFDVSGRQCPWYALLEISDSESADHARERFEAVVGQAIEDGDVVDAVIAASIAQSNELWHLRESIPLAEKQMGKNIKHDVSIPVSRMADFVEQTNAQLQAAFAGVRHIVFGHLGDGNLHYNVAAPAGSDETAFLQLQPQVYRLVHDSVHAFGGSISAEHGVGQLKKDLLPLYKSEVELALMRKIKRALDPHILMNPGKVINSADI